MTTNESKEQYGDKSREILIQLGKQIKPENIELKEEEFAEGADRVANRQYLKVTLPEGVEKFVRIMMVKHKQEAEGLILAGKLSKYREEGIGLIAKDELEEVQLKELAVSSGLINPDLDVGELNQTVMSNFYIKGLMAFQTLFLSAVTSLTQDEATGNAIPGNPILLIHPGLDLKEEPRFQVFGSRGDEIFRTAGLASLPRPDIQQAPPK